jgi:hypothetical protein
VCCGSRGSGGCGGDGGGGAWRWEWEGVGWVDHWGIGINICVVVFGVKVAVIVVGRV